MESESVESGVYGSEVETESVEAARIISELESESVRVASQRGPFVSGGLGGAMECKPQESTRKGVEVDAEEPVVEESEPVMRVGKERPAALRRLGKGWKLEVEILIKYSIAARVLLGSGASRNVIKAELRRRMMEDSIGKDFVMGHYQGETKISIAGTHANDIFEFYQRSFCFQKEGMPAGALLTVQFGEMESCTDDVSIGVFAVAHVGKVSAYFD